LGLATVFLITPILAFPHQGGRDFGLDQEYPFLSHKAVFERTISSFTLDGGRLGWGDLEGLNSPTIFFQSHQCTVIKWE
jgi:hypothetical protein